MAFDYLCFFANDANHQADIAIGRFGVNPFKKSDFVPEIYVERQGWDPEIAQQYADTLMEMEEGSTNRVFPLRVPGVFQFNSAVATGTSKALAGQLSPQEALDEVAAEWKKIVKRIGADTIREAYAIGVAEPVSVMINTFGTGKIPSNDIARIAQEEFDMRPRAIIETLDLLRPIYRNTAAYGHFGRELSDFTWERTDRVDSLKKRAGI